MKRKIIERIVIFKKGIKKPYKIFTSWWKCAQWMEINIHKNEYNNFYIKSLNIIKLIELSGNNK